MKIIEKIRDKNADNYGAPVTIAFLGDSVTHGCFDCYTNEKGQVDTYFDATSAYPTRLWEMMHLLYTHGADNIINSGISGDNTLTAAGGASSATLLILARSRRCSYRTQRRARGDRQARRIQEQSRGDIRQSRRDGRGMHIPDAEYDVHKSQLPSARRKPSGDGGKSRARAERRRSESVFRRGERGRGDARRESRDVYSVWETHGESGRRHDGTSTPTG